MDLNQLSLFLAVAEARSFTGAAKTLGLERSAVSRGIAALERDLDVQLLHRTTRQVALTSAGTALYAKVAPHLRSVSDALGSLPEREEQPSGRLRLTAPNDLGSTLLPPILAEFSLRYPAVELELSLSHRIVDLVAEGFDAALRIGVGRLADSSLIARRLAEIGARTFASPGYLARAGTPRVPADVAKHAWVSMRGLDPPPPLPRPQRPATVVADDILFLYGAVKAGMGLGLLPTFLTAADVRAGTLVQVLPRVSTGSGTLYFVHPPAQHVPRKVTALRDHLLASLPLQPGLAPAQN